MKSIVIDTVRIRDRAYSRWQEQGCPAGTAERDWLEAEREIAAQCAGENSPPSALPTKQRPKPPRPTLERGPNARAAKRTNDAGSKGPPQSRTQRALAAAAAAHIKRTAVGSG